MATAIATAISPFQMIDFGKHQKTIFVQVKVFRVKFGCQDIGALV